MTRPIRLEHLQPCIDWWGGADSKGRQETERAWKVSAKEIKARGYSLDIKNPHTVEDDLGDPQELLMELTRAEGETVVLRGQLKAILGGGAAAMNVGLLLEHFERIADAPEIIPRVRRFILDLAVRGKLMAQDAGDELASELLERIGVEKEQLVKAGEIRKPKRSEAISVSEGSFDLPVGWVWSSIGEICSKTGSGSTPRGGKNAYRENGILFLQSQNVYDDGLRLDNVAYID
jgi:hypothetical protein